MLMLSRIYLRIRSLLRKRTLDIELRSELVHHLEQLKAENMSKGMAEKEAELAARRAFGPVAVLEENCRDQRRTQWVENLGQDARFALRTFARSPAFTAAAVLTLALGIGANTAFFSMAYAIVFRPLPYPASDRLVQMEKGIGGVGPVTSLREMAKLAEYAGYLANNEVDLQSGGEATRVQAAMVTWNLADVLGVSPASGRWFVRAEERMGENLVVVLSDRTWRNRFAADPSAVGRRILLNEQPHEIVGVMPPGFEFPAPDTEMWIPIRIDPRNVGYMWGGANQRPIGRLKDGATIGAAQNELRPVIDQIRGMFPWRMPDLYGRGAYLVSYREALAKDVRPKLTALAGGTLLLLLIACANVANLLLARGIGREREFVMREALGAGRGRLFRQTMTENAVLIAVGGVAGLIASMSILKLLPLLLPQDTPRLHEIAVDPALVLTLAFSMLLTTVVFNVVPFISLGRSRNFGRAATPSRQSSRISLALVGVELSLATTLLIGAGLMGKSLWQLSNSDSGVQAKGLLSARVSAGPSRCGTPERCLALLQELNRTWLALPGVRSVNWTNFAPLEKQFSAVSVDIEDHPKPPGAPAFVLWQTAATPGYFDALGIRLRAGRVFTDADSRGSAPVTVISESTAKRFWPNESAIGKRIGPMSDKNRRTVVGVVSEVEQFALTGFPSWVDGVLYVPLEQALPKVGQSIQLTALIETSLPSSTAAALGTEAQRRFSGVAVSRVATLERIRSESLTDQRSTAWLLGLFAGLGLLLGAAGVHGVVSHRVAQRTQEIAIRIALGSSARRVTGMVLRETFLASLIGCVVGMGMAAVLARFLRSMLFGVAAHDVAAFTLCPIVLLMAALLVAAVPGVRASRTDPAVTLRQG